MATAKSQINDVINTTASIKKSGKTDNQLQAEQLRKALQLFANTFTEEQAMELSTVYPKWKGGVVYKVGNFTQNIKNFLKNLLTN